MMNFSFKTEEERRQFMATHEMSPMCGTRPWRDEEIIRSRSLTEPSVPIKQHIEMIHQK